MTFTLFIRYQVTYRTNEEYQIMVEGTLISAFFCAACQLRPPCVRAVVVPVRRQREADSALPVAVDERLVGRALVAAMAGRVPRPQRLELRRVAGPLAERQDL